MNDTFRIPSLFPVQGAVIKTGPLELMQSAEQTIHMFLFGYCKGTLNTVLEDKGGGNLTSLQNYSRFDCVCVFPCCRPKDASKSIVWKIVPRVRLKVQKKKIYMLATTLTEIGYNAETGKKFIE